MIETIEPKVKNPYLATGKDVEEWWNQQDGSRQIEIVEIAETFTIYYWKSDHHDLFYRWLKKKFKSEINQYKCNGCLIPTFKNKRFMNFN